MVKYLIVQDWPSTHGNHAGMVHMCRLLCEKYPTQYKMFVKDIPQQLPRRSSIMTRLIGWYDRLKYSKQNTTDYIKLCQPMFDNLKFGDEVFLLEYNWPDTSQYGLARYIKTNFPEIKIFALSHLTSTWYERIKGSRSMILRWNKFVDKQLTLGSSLTEYLTTLGIPQSKISTGFHYVDHTYYSLDSINLQPRVTVITMGALQRDYSLLADIVKNCSTVNWIICKGSKSIDHLFEGFDNVTLYGYLEEAKLRDLMARSDISLNVLEDTVGSNVITTSMAMGLAIVVSDVGSIRDYCSEQNAVFCENNSNSFINAINTLATNSEKLISMRENSYQKSADFRIEYINDWFNNLN